MGTRGCINYNPVLAIRQLGDPMRRAPSEEGLTPFIARGFNSTNAGVLQRVRKAWEMVQKKDEELRGSSHGPIGGYHRWLKAYAQGLDWLPNLRTTKEVEGRRGGRRKGEVGCEATEGRGEGEYTWQRGRTETGIVSPIPDPDSPTCLHTRIWE